MAFADLSDIFPIQSLLYFQRSSVTRHRRASHRLCKLHYTLPSQREFGPPVIGMARCGLGEASSLISGGWGQGHPMDLFPKISVLQAKFCWLGNLEKLMSLEVKCCWAIHNSGCHRGFGVYNSLYVLFVYLSSPH